MGGQIQAVFLDIDGTLVYKGRLTDSAKVTVDELKKNGLFVALCTGRSRLHTHQIQQQLGIRDAVYFNGGLAINKQRIVQSSPLAQDVVARIRNFSVGHELPLILHAQDEALVFDDIPGEFQGLLEDYQFPDLRPVEENLWQETSTKVYQANVFMKPTWDQVAQNQFPECLLYRWDEKAVDLQKRGCDKSLGALAILREEGISPSETLHIGDGGNDIGMFQTMGMSVAMGNAPKEVQHQARMVTARVEEDGVYHAMKDLNLI